MPTGQELSDYYQSGWEQPENRTEKTGGTDLKLARTYARGIGRELGLRSFRGLRVLDYGAGRGSLTSALAQSGAEVYAVDPFAFANLRDRGIRAFPSLQELPPGLTFDGVVSVDCLEHLAEPTVVLNQLRRLASPSGWLWVSTPNSASLRALLMGGRWEEAHKPGHLLLFGPNSLERVMSTAGWKRLRRLDWRVDYRRGALARTAHLALQTLRLDGELRYLAYKH